MSGLGDLLFGSAAQSHSESDSSQQQVGGSASSSFGIQGSGSQSSELSQSRSGQQIAFEDLFAKLYGGAAGAAAGVDTGALTGAANSLFTGGTDFLSSLESGAQGGVNALEARATDTTARDAQLNALQQSLGDLFNQQLLPGITGNEVAHGTLGGSRDAVAKSMAAQAVGRQFVQGAAGIISADQQQKDTAAAQLAAFGPAALTLAPGLLGLSSAGALAPYAALKDILGAPTVLSSAESGTQAGSVASSFGQQGSKSYGFDFGSGSSHSVTDSVGGTQGLAQSFLAGGGLAMKFAA